MRLQIKLIICLLVIFAAGCSQGVRNLMKLSESQQEMYKEVQSEEDRYNKLLDDIKNNRLKTGLAKKQVISLYGEPLITETGSWLYHHPTKYFSAEQVYLNFNKEGTLVSWELRPTK